MISDLIRTTTFRLALVYMGLFSLSAAVLFIFIFWTTAGFMARQTDETLRAEIEGLQEQYRQRGLPGLIRIVIERSGEADGGLYYVAAPGGARVAGNLTALPETAAPGWTDFTYARGGANGAAPALRAARGWRANLRGGYVLLVARDVDERVRLQRRMRAALGWGGLLTVLLGVIGGVAMSRNVMRRIEAANRAAEDIMAGDLSRRVAVSGAGDELDHLAVNLNSMLDQIERLMAGMRDVSDNIAHDLRSPLTRLRGRIEEALRQPRDAAADGRVLEETIEEADRLLATFSALLSIARLEAGAASHRFTDIDGRALVEDLAELYAPVAQEAGAALRLRPFNGPADFKGSRELLAQALSNLVDNALKYSGGGRIEIAAAVSPQGVELAVIDEGPGIAPDDRACAAERFVRLEKSRSAPGSGLGLALVSAVATLHGGRLSLTDGDIEGAAGPGLKAAIQIPAQEKMRSAR